jgi:hypothetical protein
VIEEEKKQKHYKLIERVQKVKAMSRDILREEEEKNKNGCI